MNDIQQVSVALPIGSLDAYIHQANRIPMLTPEEEFNLASELQQQGDLDAARKLVLAHLRYVIRVARGYLGYGLALGDLIQEGNVGLMKAVKRFDPQVGVRLVSFAVHWIKAEIHEFILKNWRIVKIATTKAQRKLFFNLRSMKKRLGWFSADDISAVAKDLKVSEKEVMAMEQRLDAMDLAFNSPAHASLEDESDQFTPAGYIEDHSYNPERLVTEQNLEDTQHDKLKQVFETLDERARDIVQSRWLDEKKATLHDLAAKYGVSAERIRQLENNALKKMKQAIAAV